MENKNDIINLLNMVRRVLEKNNVYGNVTIDAFSHPHIVKKGNTIDLVKRIMGTNDNMYIYFSGEDTSEYTLILTQEITKYLLVDEFIYKIEGLDIVGYENLFLDSSLDNEDIEKIDLLLDLIEKDSNNIIKLIKILEKIEYRPC